MAITLTPDQQAKLDQFEADAEAAVMANAESASTDAQLVTLQARADHLKQDVIDDMAAALKSAKAFVDAMLGNVPIVLPAGAGAKPK